MLGGPESGGEGFDYCPSGMLSAFCILFEVCFRQLENGMNEPTLKGDDGISAKVEPATRNDIPRLTELLTLLFAQEREFSPDSAKQTEGLERIISGPDLGHILVLRKEGDIVAMVNLLYTVSTALGGLVAVLEDMIVHPDQRGTGAGSLLLQAAIEFAKGEGCRRITLLTDHDNSGAIRFYRRHGFRQSSMVPMRLVLEPSDVRKG